MGAQFSYELDLAGNVRRLRHPGDGSDLGGYRYTAFGKQYPPDAGTPTPSYPNKSLLQALRWKMGHALEPRNGGHLPAKEVARRLGAEFAYIEVDEAEGMKRARARADWLERAPAQIFLGRHKEALEAAAQLKTLAPGEALTIDFGDDANITKRIVVMPGEAIKFGYSSQEDEVASREWVERCARALDCDIVLF